MRIRIKSRTVGTHTHMDLWINGRLVAEDMALRNEDVSEFLVRLRPEALDDSTPVGHTRVAYA